MKTKTHRDMDPKSSKHSWLLKTVWIIPQETPYENMYGTESRRDTLLKDRTARLINLLLGLDKQSNKIL